MAYVLSSDQSALAAQRDGIATLTVNINQHPASLGAPLVGLVGCTRKMQILVATATPWASCECLIHLMGSYLHSINTLNCPSPRVRNNVSRILQTGTPTLRIPTYSQRYFHVRSSSSQLPRKRRPFKVGK